MNLDVIQRRKEGGMDDKACFRNMDESLRGTVGKLLVGTEARVFVTHLYVSQTDVRKSFFLFCLIWVKLIFHSLFFVKVEDLNSRQLVEPGQPGELLIKGPQVQKTPTETKA